MLTEQSLINSNIKALEEGAELLELLEVEQYTSGFKPAFQSTIGAHFRHVLEHYRCLLSQIGSGLICYDRRERDQLLECDLDYAKRSIAELRDSLVKFDESAFERDYLIDDEQSAGSVTTTLQRELLFLQSHSMHHYAIIGAMTRAFGRQPADDFGVAIATRTHQAQCANDRSSTEQTLVKETPTCAQ